MRRALRLSAERASRRQLSPPRPTRQVQRRRAGARRQRACAMTRELQLITSDVDGTLLNSKQELTPRVQRAIQLSREQGVPGLLVFNHDGALIRNVCLDEAVVVDNTEFAREHGLTVCAYCTDEIFTEEINADSDRLLFYGEPTPQGVGPLAKHLKGRSVQKLILMSTDERIQALRPLANETIGRKSALTQALPGMLEVLPPGASKGVGVQCLLDALNIPASALMALGDGENDVEMLKLAGLGVAVGNAGPAARAAADVVLDFTNDQDAVAEAIQKFVLEPRGVALD